MGLYTALRASEVLTGNVFGKVIQSNLSLRNGNIYILGFTVINIAVSLELALQYDYNDNITIISIIHWYECTLFTTPA